MNKRYIFFFIILLNIQYAISQNYQIAVLKYNGGGDWYANLETSLPNLIDFSNKNLGTTINREQALVEIGSPLLFDYPFIHMTGHGNVVFSSQESENLRNYLIGGGFLHIDDNYGMDQFIRSELKKVFPEYELVEIPFDHPIYHQKFDFNKGLPKIHEHDDLDPKGFGILHEGRLVLFYTYESDLGDGWEDEEVHNDNLTKRTAALEMGSNIISYVFLSNDK